MYYDANSFIDKCNGFWDETMVLIYYLTFCFISNNQKSYNKWSEQTTKLKDGNVPLPLLAALHVRGDKTITAYNEWIELSPYEVFIPKYGAAIDMKDFGDEFYGGFVIENCGEKPISFLQGMCGSGYAIVKNFRPTEIRRLMFWSAFKLWVRSWFKMFDRKFIWKVPNYLRGLSTVPVNKADKGQPMDSVDVEKRDMMLVDAGIAFNSPYPTVFRPSRKVDVILSFDFSDRGEDDKWPFRELENASQWARERNIPFPHIDPLLKEIREKCADTGEYEEVYIFPGDDSPTIVHFVMINKSFRNAETYGYSDFKILPTYATLKLRYTNVDFDKLSRLTMHNVQNNKKKILDSIRAEIKKKT